MKQRIQFWSTLGAAMISGLLVATSAQAEGSKQLTPNNNPSLALTDPANTRAGYLTHDVNLSGTGTTGGQDVSLGFLKPSTWVGPAGQAFSPDYRMLVHMEPGETLYYGVHRQPVSSNAQTQADLILTLRYGANAGTVVQTTTLQRDAASPNQSTLLTTINGQPQAGVIANATQAQAGPLPNAGGYQPLTYTNTTGAAQEFYVEFTQVGEASMTADDLRSDYDLWDFTVRTAAGVEKPGRLYSKHWAFTAGISEISGNTNQFLNRLSANFILYPMVESRQNPGSYFVKEVELAGMRPLVFFFVSNEFGSDTQFGTTFATRRRSQLSKSSYTQYPNFVNNPDPAVWPSAAEPTVSVTPQAFCQAGVTKVAFTTQAAESGDFEILIDLNGTAGYQAGTRDVLIPQSVTAGTTNTVIWDGKDGLGAQVASNTTVTFNFTSNGAPVNFPVFDAEGNPDGFRVRNARSSNPSAYDLLYWDDSLLPTAKFPAPQTQLTGVNSSTGVHRWGTTTDDGDSYTVNTWTYGFSVFTGSRTFVYTDICDNDKDGVADATDIDDDNDGILDVVEAMSGTTSVDPGAFASATSPIRYLDASYVHPVLGAFLDTNNDGVNDLMDVDRDGIPNHFDLDADGDGLADALEANGNTNPTLNFGPVSVTIGNGSNATTYTYQSSYSAAQGRYITTATGTAPINGIYAGVGRNGLPDAVEGSVAYGKSGTGNNETVTVTENSASRYSLTDNDNDLRTNSNGTARNYNFLDIDSDNDGITDEIEALSTAVYNTRRGQANFNADTDRDGLRDAYDPNNGGTAITSVLNSDGTDVADIFDIDSDNDNAGKGALAINLQTADWSEGFANPTFGVSGGEIIAKARQFALNNPGKANYYPVGGPASGVTNSPFLLDADNDKLPNFLDLDNSYYHDDNFNGLADIYDPAYGGTPSTAPLGASGASEAAFRTNANQIPLPVELISFQARAAGRDALVTWATASEKDNARFEVQRSTDGETFELAGTVQGKGTRASRSDYSFTDKGVGAVAGTRYYRLRQIDLNGKESMTEVRVVNFDGRGAATLVTVYPSPTVDNATLDLLALSKATYQVDIMGADGRRMLRFETTGGREVALPVAEFAKGTYLIRVSGQGQHYLVKLLKD
ncbi:T9SS type A sorting domain-containing protein [Hymenobacter puniceus]|uniref:T9SS type A sorting domain-containing protein n=1 Tax=Hymenobacter sp. BT190 TaxID=2763505 RepID=UPI001650EFD3|nr:T9SS type A sorting domain-containing protein [Hymenobacter sp. BT190]MBC6699359.1 T9SS type A sorting domain-containing protein [Hymenobacter sp. BT190]